MFCGTTVRTRNPRSANRKREDRRLASNGLLGWSLIELLLCSVTLFSSYFVYLSEVLLHAYPSIPFSILIPQIGRIVPPLPTQTCVSSASKVKAPNAASPY